MIARIIAALVLVGVVGSIAIATCPSPEEIRSYTHTEEYQQQKRAWLERLDRLEREAR